VPILGFDPTDRAVAAFLDAHVSARGAAHWRWKYRPGPAGEPAGFAWREANGQILGYIGLMWTTLCTATAQHRAAWFVDWHVLPGDRAVGVGFGLLRKAEAAAGVLLTLQGSADTRQILPRLGWKEAAGPQTFVRPLTGRAWAAAATRRLPAPLRPLVAAGAALATPFVRATAPAAPGGARLVPVERFDTAHDAVWAARRTEFAPALRRDSDYLNYFCADYPDGGYRRWVVQQGDAAVGHLITRIDVDRRGLRRGRLVDLLWPRANRALSAWLVAAACRELQNDGTDYVECVASVGDLCGALVAAGFRARRPVPIWYHRLPADAGEPGSWYVTLLDCDRAYR